MNLTEYLIHLANGPAYRSGALEGARHPEVDAKMIREVGGRKALLQEADELERAGLIRTERRDMDTDIRRIHYNVGDIPALCRRAGMEDPREKQLRRIGAAKKWADNAAGTFLESYYRNLLERLEAGQEVKQPDPEDEKFFQCLNAAAALESPVWRRRFSAAVLHDSKLFERKYQKKVVTVLAQYSPLCVEGMTEDDVLRVHGIKTYSQTLEWKGPLVYRIICEESADSADSVVRAEDGGRAELRPAAEADVDVIDSSANCFGTVINAQTLEHAEPVSLSGIRWIMLIENKANYESMDFRADTLYIFCHGFFSPKELKFLGRLASLAEEGTEFLHWGDMDLGGIRIFLYNQRKLFPELKPYRMDREAYECAVAAGAGIPLDRDKSEKLRKMDAGCLEELKKCILEQGMEIEQESLLFCTLSSQAESVPGMGTGWFGETYSG